MSGGGEKTEQPTEKRLRDARRKGQVARSQDLASALLFFAAVIVLIAGGAWAGTRILAAIGDGIFYASAFRGQLDQASAIAAVTAAVRVMAVALAPLLATMVVVGLLANVLQVRFSFSPEAVKPKLSKLNLAQNFQEKFLKSRPYIELAKTLVKMTLAAVIVGRVLWAAREDLVNLTGQPAASVAYFVGALIGEIGVKVGVAFLLIGAADFFLQRFLFLKEMRMSKHEVKEEMKETEGNPLVKAVRRHLHYEMSMQNMAQAVRKADVVVVNPTHLAVALKYDRATMAAPTVVAKGAELMAAQIRQLATEAEVPVMRDVPLARALYELELDQEISEELYEAVAAVLRWVYQLAAEKEEVVTAHG